MVEMVSRRLQQGLLMPASSSGGGSGRSHLCGAMREAILTLCRDNLTYGGQVEVDGIICITGPHDGQQLVVKVHELLDNNSLLASKSPRLDHLHGGGGGSRDGNDKKHNNNNNNSSSSSSSNKPPKTQQPPPPPKNEDTNYNGEHGASPPGDDRGNSPPPISTVTLNDRIAPSETNEADPREARNRGRDQEEEGMDERDSERLVDRRTDRRTDHTEDRRDEEVEDEEERNELDEEDEALNMSDPSSSTKGLDNSHHHGEMEALDLRLDSPAARAIKQEPMEYEESPSSHRYHPYGSSSSSGSIYRPCSSHDGGGHLVEGVGNSLMGGFDDRYSLDGSMSRRARSSSPHTPHTPLLVPFMGPAHPHHPPDMSDTASFSAGPPGASPFMDSRLRHLLSKMPYGKPHPGLPFLRQRPLFPTMSMLHSGAPECKACGFTFAQVELLKEHNEAVHAVFTCNVCYRTFTSRSNLDRHSRLHTGHKPYICVKCGKAFSRKDHLTNHSAKHAFKCGKCLKRFVERDALQGHYDQDHQVMLTNICEHCNKGFSDPAVFAEHLKSHPEYLGGAKIHPKHKPFACTDCNYVCADKLQLLKHSQVHGESGKNLVYNCLACGESFGDPLLYSQHFEGHQEETDVFECCICRKMCQTWRELKQHEQTHLHPSSRGPTLACPVCYIIFDNPDVLAEHVQSHDPSVVDLDGFPCNVCNEVFPTLEEQQRHEQEEKHYVKKAFISPHPHPLTPSPLPPLLSLPASDPSSPRPASADCRTHYSSVCDSDSNDSEEELDVIAVDEPSDMAPSTSTRARNASPEADDNKGERKERFVVTDNPAPIIEVSNTEADSRNVRSPPSLGGGGGGGAAVSCRSHSSSSSSPFAASLVSTASLPIPPPSAAVFPERSPLHPSIASISPPPLPLHHGPATLASIMSSHSPQPSPDGLTASWLPPGAFHHHNHNNTVAAAAAAYGFTTHLTTTEYACPMCDAKLLSFHDYETHCFSDHFRYPCMYCTKTFAQKANRDRHVCIHTGEKPYTCPECDQKFARGDKLKIHRTKWHNIQFPTTYNRPKEGTGAGSGDWPSSRRNKDSTDDLAGSHHGRSNSGGRWSDSESQDQGLGDNDQDRGSSNRISIKAEGSGTRGHE